MQTKKQCGAKTRGGGTCKNAPMPNGRCRMHGGKSPKTNTSALKHGIYFKGLRPEEREVWERIPVGSIEDEIKVAKLQLARAMEAQRKIEEAAQADKDTAEGFELAETKHESGVGAKGPVDTVTVTKKRPDYRQVINSLLGRIASLEATQSSLQKEAREAAIARGESDVDWTAIGKSFSDAVAQIRPFKPGQADAGAPDDA